MLIFFVIHIGGHSKKVNVFETFIEGAKQGFEMAVKIIPYLVAMLVAISVLRTSGVFDTIIQRAEPGSLRSLDLILILFLHCRWP